MKESFLNSALIDENDEKICEHLWNSRETVVRLFNKKMGDNFIKEFEKNKTNAAVFNQVIKPNLFKDDYVNTDCLKQFREFEEKTFTEKPKRGV